MLKVGTFLPLRPFAPSLTIDPAAGIGCLRPELRSEILAALDALPGIDWTHDLNFRRAMIRNGEVFCGDVCLSALDAFVWYCEVDRSPASFDQDVLRTLARTTKVIRDPAAFLQAVDKYQAHLCLRDAGLRVPDFVLFDHRAPDAMTAVLETWGAAVLKPRLGGWGKGVTLVDHPGQLRDIVDYVGAAGARPSFFLERYCPNDLSRWVSVLLIGGEIVYAYRKLASKHVELLAGRAKILDQDERGGEVALVALSELTPEHATLALAADRALGCGLIGFDMLWTDDGPVIIDENTSPGHYADLFAQAGISAAEAWARWLRRALEG